MLRLYSKGHIIAKNNNVETRQGTSLQVKMYEKKKCFLWDSPKGNLSFLSAAFTGKVGGSEAQEDDDAAADGSVLVVFQAVDGHQGGDEDLAFLADVLGAEIGVSREAVLGVVAALEEATLSESGQAKANDDY